ncbi:hypothetical protein [uncultured Jannaschia sp.]|uniref:hypothetical protein n=1 Tax=uncultured Jannaschia sp. TaxID=293347 RepID=UPI00261B1706|nr:hypothetical protein [uncultured Jannaschia sp.]
MFDAIETTQTTTAWQDHLAPGDAVAFRCPAPGEGDGASVASGPRPCLVLDIETVGRQPMALLACGTASPRPSNRFTDIDVRRAAERRAAGLEAPTRFVGTRRLFVPLGHDGFAVSPATGSPVRGRLEGALREPVQTVRGRLHALRDIRAEARRRRPARHDRRTRRQGTDFTVEVRRSRRPLRAVRAGQ